MVKSHTESSLAGKVLVFVLTSGPARIPMYQQLEAQGATVVMVHPGTNPRVPRELFQHYVDCLDYSDPDVLEAAVRKYLSKHDLEADAVLSFDEYGLYPAAVLAERLGKRPTPLPSCDIRATNVKSSFRAWCYAHNISAPRSIAIRAGDDLEKRLANVASELSFPVVVKPSQGAGKLLIKRCVTDVELREYARQALERLVLLPEYHHLAAIGEPPHLLIEEFIGGQEVDIDCVVANGEVVFAGISDNFEPLAPHFKEVGGLAPSILPAHAQEALLELLQSWVHSHGTRVSGVLHFEAKYDHARGAAYVIEVNLRPGGAETNTMVSTVWGVSLGECSARLALGLPLPSSVARASPHTYCASVNTYTSTAGIIASAAPCPATLADPHLVAYEKVNDGMPAPCPATFITWMVAQGDSAEDAVEHIKRFTAAYELQMQCDCPCHRDTDGHCNTCRSG